ncbi:hypothetical protein TNCT_183851 [Trichonephila clavata]|uniref:Uncharacterized protein n=1 Tax=Trichonephila clavata TaxID=2740835 RepID=A0A8X6JS84_TRICU|nr:hypothetical protein TNCT_183851 [Trichonephila clavata]
MPRFLNASFKVNGLVNSVCCKVIEDQIISSGTTTSNYRGRKYARAEREKKQLRDENGERSRKRSMEDGKVVMVK